MSLQIIARQPNIDDNYNRVIYLFMHLLHILEKICLVALLMSIWRVTRHPRVLVALPSELGICGRLYPGHFEF